jgi:hypothetical protein
MQYWGRDRWGLDGEVDVEEVPMDVDRAQCSMDKGCQDKDEDEEMDVVRTC